MLHLIPLSLLVFREIICWKTQDMLVGPESFSNSSITKHYDSPFLDVPMNTKGEIRGSSKGSSALVATSSISQPRKQD